MNANAGQALKTIKHPTCRLKVYASGFDDPVLSWVNLNTGPGEGFRNGVYIKRYDLNLIWGEALRAKGYTVVKKIKEGDLVFSFSLSLKAINWTRDVSRFGKRRLDRNSAIPTRYSFEGTLEELVTVRRLWFDSWKELSSKTSEGAVNLITETYLGALTKGLEATIPSCKKPGND